VNTQALWLEWHHELRRHAGDERLPPDLRVHLRERAQRALARLTSAMPAPFPRRQLRDAAPVLLPPELRDTAVKAAATSGVDLHARFVAFDVRRNPAAIVPAIDWLVNQGYAVLGIGASDPIRRPGVIDVRATAHADLVDRIVIERAKFVVCDSGERQQAAVLANTPSLRLNAREPFSAYPVRGNDIFTLADIVDLDSGRVLLPNELLSEPYLRHVRNYGLRPNRAEQVLAAVQEIHEGVTAGWREDANQMRVRERVTDAGVSLASRVPLVAEWGPDEGFLGDGRLARCQAGQML
jgi:putative glycosyltransferase (TIGR04372 family)